MWGTRAEKTSKLTLALNMHRSLGRCVQVGQRSGRDATMVLCFVVVGELGSEGVVSERRDNICETCSAHS